jgi:hypothetical protein
MSLSRRGEKILKGRDSLTGPSVSKTFSIRILRFNCRILQQICQIVFDILNCVLKKNFIRVKTNKLLRSYFRQFFNIERYFRL